MDPLGITLEILSEALLMTEQTARDVIVEDGRPASPEYGSEIVAAQSFLKWLRCTLLIGHSFDEQLFAKDNWGVHPAVRCGHCGQIRVARGGEV